MARILIVDDQKSVLLTLEALLSKDGHSITSATNAMEAIRALGAGHFDLVITDAVMPNGDGYSLVRAIRKQPAFEKLPVILLTGKREKSDIEKGIETGVNDYIVKPIDPELVLAKVRNLLVTKPEDAVKFAQTPVHYKAEIETKMEVVFASELGLQINSNIPLPLGKILKFKTQFFDEVGISNIPLRIDSCSEVPGASSYQVTAHFVGITEKELSPIRLWIRSRRAV